MRHIKTFVTVLLILSSPLSFAKTELPALNTIKLQLNDETWVKTATAKVIIAVDATLNDTQLANSHRQMLANLKKINENADWQITQFNRSKDQSNLERLQALAEARMDDAALAQINKKVEAVTKPGAAYRVAAIEFNPSLADMEIARHQLREKLYNQIKSELANLNKIYPEAHYFVHEINFSESIAPVVNRAKIMMLAIGNAPQNDGGGLHVSNPLKLTADIVLASKINNMQGRAPSGK